MTGLRVSSPCVSVESTARGARILRRIGLKSIKNKNHPIYSSCPEPQQMLGLARHLVASSSDNESEEGVWAKKGWMLTLVQS